MMNKGVIIMLLKNSGCFLFKVYLKMNVIISDYIFVFG